MGLEKFQAVNQLQVTEKLPENEVGLPNPAQVGVTEPEVFVQ